MIAHEPGSILLEREFSSECRGRSLLFRKPRRVIQAREAAEVRDGLLAVETALSQGCWVAGYISYEAGYALESSLIHLCRPLPDGSPLLWLGCYDAPLISEEAEDRTACHRDISRAEHRYSLGANEYGSRVEAIRDRIARGETYQANLTMDVDWATDEEPAEMYERLLQAQPVCYAALLHPEQGWHVLSLSPELFFARNGPHILTRPMKGTASPGLDLEESRANAAWLRADEKNRAENVMIVDLLRNDLGRICDVGSVKVRELFEIERYPTVLQMTSTIEGQLREDVVYAELFGALFPSGSIVGAPKVHTMRLLHQIEGRPRGVYSGAIGYIAPHGIAKFNVAIRTVSLREGRARFGVGSGIVYDSFPQEEYAECKIKATFLSSQPVQEFCLIETLLFENGTYVLLDEHLQRMRYSAEYFNIGFDPDRFDLALAAAVQSSGAGERLRVRLLLDPRGDFTWSSSRFDPCDDASVRILLSTERTDPADGFLRHKTTQRALYDQAHAAATKEGYTDMLFCNLRNEITECAIHNVIVSIAGRMFTPPLLSGVLPGVYRRRLLQEGRVTERVLSQLDLVRAEEVYLCNSVRGLRRVARIEEQASGGISKTIWSSTGMQLEEPASEKAGSV